MIDGKFEEYIKSNPNEDEDQVRTTNQSASVAESILVTNPVVQQEVSIKKSTLDTLNARTKANPNIEQAAFILRKGNDEVIVYYGVSQQNAVKSAVSLTIDALRAYTSQGYVIVADYHNHSSNLINAFVEAGFPPEFVLSPSLGDTLLTVPLEIERQLGQKHYPRIIGAYFPQEDVVKAHAFNVERQYALGDAEETDVLLVAPGPVSSTPRIKVISETPDNAAVMIAKGMITPLSLALDIGNGNSISQASIFTPQLQLTGLQIQKRNIEGQITLGMPLIQAAHIQDIADKMQGYIAAKTKSAVVQQVSRTSSDLTAVEQAAQNFIEGQKKDCDGAFNFPFVERVYATSGKSCSPLGRFFKATNMDGKMPIRNVWGWASSYVTSAVVVPTLSSGMPSFGNNIVVDPTSIAVDEINITNKVIYAAIAINRYIIGPMIAMNWTHIFGHQISSLWFAPSLIIEGLNHLAVAIVYTPQIVSNFVDLYMDYSGRRLASRLAIEKAKSFALEQGMTKEAVNLLYKQAGEAAEVEQKSLKSNELSAWQRYLRQNGAVRDATIAQNVIFLAMIHGRLPLTQELEFVKLMNQYGFHPDAVAILAIDIARSPSDKGYAQKHRAPFGLLLRESVAHIVTNITQSDLGITNKSRNDGKVLNLNNANEFMQKPSSQIESQKKVISEIITQDKLNRAEAYVYADNSLAEGDQLITGIVDYFENQDAQYRALFENGPNSIDSMEQLRPALRIHVYETLQQPALNKIMSYYKKLPVVAAFYGGLIAVGEMYFQQLNKSEFMNMIDWFQSVFGNAVDPTFLAWHLPEFATAGLGLSLLYWLSRGMMVMYENFGGISQAKKQIARLLRGLQLPITTAIAFGVMFVFKTVESLRDGDPSWIDSGDLRAVIGGFVTVYIADMVIKGGMVSEFVGLLKRVAKNLMSKMKIVTVRTGNVAEVSSGMDFNSILGRTNKILGDALKLALPMFVAGLGVYIAGTWVQNLSYVDGAYPQFVNNLSHYIGAIATNNYNFWRWQLNDFGVALATTATSFGMARMLTARMLATHPERSKWVNIASTVLAVGLLILGKSIGDPLHPGKFFDLPDWGVYAAGPAFFWGSHWMSQTIKSWRRGFVTMLIVGTLFGSSVIAGTPTQKAVSAVAQVPIVAQIVDGVESLQNTGCFSFNPFVQKVYAADSSSSTCLPVFMSRNALAREIRDNVSLREGFQKEITRRTGVRFVLSKKDAGPDGCKFPKCIRVDRALLYVAISQLVLGDWNTRWVADIGKELVDKYVPEACKSPAYFAFHNIEEGRIDMEVAKALIKALLEKDSRDRDGACERLTEEGKDASAFQFAIDTIDWEVREVNGNREYYTSDPRIIEYLHLSVDGEILPAFIIQTVGHGAIAKLSDWNSIVAAYAQLGKNPTDPVYVQFLAQDIPDAPIYKLNGIPQGDFSIAINDRVTTPWLVSNNGKLSYVTTPNATIAENDTAIRILWPFNYSDSLFDYSYKGNNFLIEALHGLAVRDPSVTPAEDYYGTYIGMISQNTEGVPVNIMVAPGLIWSEDLHKNLISELENQGIDKQAGLPDPVIHNAVNQYWGLNEYEIRPNVFDYDAWLALTREIQDESADPNAAEAYILIH